MNITQFVWVPVFLSFFLIPRPLYGFSGSAHSNAILLDSNWQFIFTGNDSSESFTRIDTSRVYETVKLPHIFPQKKNDKAPVSGFGWYYRDIEIPSSFSDKEVFLEFEGVCLRSTIFVDGVSVAEKKFAYLPFGIDCTPYLQGKTHLRLAVRVDNRLLPRQFPDKNARGWWMYGGLIREVFLSARSKLRIDSVEIRTVHYDKDTFGLSLKLKPAQVLWDSAVILMISGDRHVPKHRITIVGTDTLLRIGGIREWTPESPFRYEFSMVPFFKGRAGDTLRLQRGFCQLAAKKSKLYLNGNPYYLRGMARHDVLGSKGPLLTREDRRRDLLDLKSLGVNFLRIAHFPQHRDIYELCDSLGLLIMDEMPAWKTESRFLGSREGREYGASYMKSLIASHGNYTCVCIWSLGNQFGSFKSSVADYVGAVSAAVKKNDPFRLVTFCSYYYLWDKAFSFVDVIAINEYFGWELASLGMLPPLLDRINNEWPGKPVLVSELGAQAKRGLRNPDAKLAGAVTSIFTKDLSEDHQALFIRSHMDTIWNKRGYVNGMVVWAYSDYLSSMNKAHTPDMPAGLNSCGIVTHDREKKLSYEVVANRYSFFRERFAAEQIIPAARR
jgi:beta-galactosidase/beta-glucuronidase